MKKMQIFEPAMCCSTGLCGIGVDHELLRISTVLDSLTKQRVIVDRFNLTSNPMEFVKNTTIQKELLANGVDSLPIIVVDGTIVLTGRYPSDNEFVSLLELKDTMISKQPGSIKIKLKSGGGCCSGGDCC